MRRHALNILLDSDVDLTKLSSKRVTITNDNGRYRVSSSLRFYRCEMSAFVYQYLRRKKPGMIAIAGNCSAPTGYFWSPPASWHAS